MISKNSLIFSVLSCLILSFSLGSDADAFTLRADFDSSGNTQAGWQSLSGSDSDLGDSWSKNFSGGVSIDVDAVGAVTLDDRDRGAGNGGGVEGSMWRDFLFANGSFNTVPGSGLSIVISGLNPDTVYPITIWAFDDSSDDGRAADWSGGGGGPARLSFPSSPTPSSLTDYKVTFDVMTNGAGGVTLSGLVAAANPNVSHNVFINGLEIGDPESDGEPTDPLRINEILARNGGGDDWIEIFNPNSVSVNLEGYYLTDDEFLLTQWVFPSVTIGPSGYLQVFASGDDLVDGGGAPHTNFQLSGSGEFLAIVRPDGTTIDDSLAPAYPEQFADVSYGLVPGGDVLAFFASPTPGTVNSNSPFPGVVKDTSFDVDRGFYTESFQLTISTETPDATIRYTTDGSKPSPSAGTIYSEPLTISTTTPVRAIAYFQDWLPTNVDSHTYIFIEDVVRQPSNPPGWRSDWTFDSQVGRVISADYEMDARVVDNTNGLGVYTVQEALLDLPSVSISMDQGDVTGASRGIYTKPRDRVEFEGSVEYIRPDGGRGFQEDCKVETHGNSSRTPSRMQKHSLRLTFSSDVGVSKLRFPLFPDSDVEEFNKLVLRACFTDSWALNTWSTDRYRPNDSLYMRDVWMKETHRAMGHLAGTGDFVHLYVNGLYWGLHDLTERIEDDWYADHIGGEKLDWEVSPDFQSPGPLWNAMMGILNGNIADNAVYQQALEVIDIDNYIDYILLHMYGDTEDFLASNGYAAANAASGDGKMRFQIWDQEITLDEHKWYSATPSESLSRGGNRYNTNTGGSSPFQRLRLNSEFRMRFADRVHLHLFNGGALSLEKAAERFVAISNEIDKAIVAESARWGDTQAGTVGYGDTAGSSNDPFADFWPPAINSGNAIYFTREQHWLPERDYVVDTYMPIIYDADDSRGILNEMRNPSTNLYPSIDPPVYNQHGGVVGQNFDLVISAAAGDIYYTTDGSDPRELGGGINPNAVALAGGTITDEFIPLEDTDWLYLDTGAVQSDSDVVVGNGSYGTGDWKHPNFDDSGWLSGQAFLGYGSITGDGVTITKNTVVGFGPSTTNRYTTTYFRKPFVVTGAANYLEIDVSIIREDGAIIYLNGKEIGRSNLPGGVVSFSDFADRARPESELVALPTFALSPGDLLEGLNVLAIEVHQESLGSSDMGIDAMVTAVRPNSAGASGPTLTQTGPVLARALSDGEWSALTQASFIVGTAAAESNLVVSEIFYNPPGSLEDSEFIELMNISAGFVDLTGVTMTGIDYAFPDGFTLAASERVVIVKDPAGFAAAYDTAGIRVAPGDFGSTSLVNGGEEIAVIAQDGVTDIKRFEYDDEDPWPESADGPGFSLVLIVPGTNPDHSLASSWRASAVLGGSPGGSDSLGFSGDPDADLDSDGINAFLEYALGSDDHVSSADVLPTASIAADGRLLLTFQRNLAAGDVLYEIQVGSDLAGWTTETALVSSENVGDGTAVDVYRSNRPMGSGEREFMRLKVSLP